MVSVKYIKYFGFYCQLNQYISTAILFSFAIVNQNFYSSAIGERTDPSSVYDNPFRKNKTKNKTSKKTDAQQEFAKFLMPPGLDFPKENESSSSSDSPISVYLSRISAMNVENERIKKEKERIRKENNFLKSENFRLLEEISRLKRSNLYLSKEIEYKISTINSISNLVDSFEEIFDQTHQQFNYLQESFTRLTELRSQMNNRLLKNPTFRYSF